MLAFGLNYVCSSALEWGGPSSESDLNNYRGSKLRLLFKSFPGPILKSGVGSLARYGIHQETISRRPEQMYTPSDTRLRLEWLGGHYSGRTRINTEGLKCNHYLSQPWAIIDVRPLFRYGTHQTINGKL